MWGGFYCCSDFLKSIWICQKSNLSWQSEQDLWHGGKETRGSDIIMARWWHLSQGCFGFISVHCEEEEETSIFICVAGSHVVSGCCFSAHKLQSTAHTLNRAELLLCSAHSLIYVNGQKWYNQNQSIWPHLFCRQCYLTWFIVTGTPFSFIRGTDLSPDCNHSHTESLQLSALTTY